MLFTKKYMIQLLLCLTTAVASAQTQPTANAQFGSVSNNIRVNKNILSETFNKLQGQSIDVHFSSSFHFPGTVVSQQKEYDNLHSIIIRSSSFGQAMMQISKQINADGRITYTGKIFSNGGSDGFSIVPDGSGDYLLQKFEKALVLQDCQIQ
jgi:hypothetical protein